MTRNRALPAATLIALAILAAGCAAMLPKLETPQLSLVGVQLQEATLFEQRLQVRLKVRNPNDLVLPVRGLDVNFELEGEPFATGVSARQFEVPALGEAEFDMIVTANAATAILKLLSRREGSSRESLKYRISGELRTRLGMLRTVPFTESGSIPLKSLTEAPDERA